jgi:YggT family protein
MEFFRQTLNILADLLITLIFARVVFSWFGMTRSRIGSFLNNLSDPLLEPIRRLLPNTGMLDFSPIVLFFLIELIRNIINNSL